MTISTYAELQASVADWAHRSDLTAVVPDFIRLAEDKLNKRLRIRSMENDASLSSSVGSRTIALPTMFLAPIALWQIDGTERTLITPIQPEHILSSTENSEPAYWSIDGDNIAFDCEADAIYSYVLRYYKGFRLSNSDTTNWLLTNSPDVYLYGSLIESSVYTRDTSSLPIWGERYNTALSELINKENRRKAFTPLRTEFGEVVRSNIFTG